MCVLWDTKIFKHFSTIRVIEFGGFDQVCYENVYNILKSPDDIKGIVEKCLIFFLS